MRKALGMRQEDVAALLGLDAATIHRWEASKSPVDRCALAMLAVIASERLSKGGESATMKRLRALSEGKQPAADTHIDYEKKAS